MERSRLAQLRARKQLKQEEAAIHLEVDVGTLRRWETGRAHPRGHNIGKLCKVYGCSESDLGLSDEGEIGVYPPSSSLITSFITSDLSTRLLTVAFMPHRSVAEAQKKTRQTLEEFDAMNIHSITRREALQRLIAFSFYPAIPRMSTLRGSDLLNRCAVVVTVCHELAQGKDLTDLSLAFEGVSTVLPHVQAFFPDAARRTAAMTIATQAVRLQAVLARHLQGTNAAIGYARQSAQYGSASGDVLEYLESLITLAWAYYYAPTQNKQALTTMEQAVALIKDPSGIPAYSVGHVYSALSVMQAKNGVVSKASRDLAVKYAIAVSGGRRDVEIDDPLQTLIENEVHMFYHQGEHHQALNQLGDLIDSTTLAMKHPASERAHVSALSLATQASLKTKQKDLERSVALWKATMTGVRALKSEQRFEETVFTYHLMDALWSDDTRVQALRPLTVHW